MAELRHVDVYENMSRQQLESHIPNATVPASKDTTKAKAKSKST